MSEANGSEAGSSKSGAGGSPVPSRPTSAVAHSNRPRSGSVGTGRPRSGSTGTSRSRSGSTGAEGGADIGERRPSAVGSRPPSASSGANKDKDNAASGEKTRRGLSRRTPAQLKALNSQYAEPIEDMELDQTALGHAKTVDDLTHRINALKRTIDSRNMRIEAAKQKALDDFKAKLAAKAKVSAVNANTMLSLLRFTSPLFASPLSCPIPSYANAALSIYLPFSTHFARYAIFYLLSPLLALNAMHAIHPSRVVLWWVTVH
jgi:hypothetical protein